MKIETIKKGQAVKLLIPAARPIMTLAKVLHTCDDKYKVLGTFGTCVRLSRVGDFQKLIVTPEMLVAA